MYPQNHINNTYSSTLNRLLLLFWILFSNIIYYNKTINITIIDFNRLPTYIFFSFNEMHALLGVEEELMQKHSQDLTGSHLKIISLSFDLCFTGLTKQSNTVFQLGITVLRKLFTLWCWEKSFQRLNENDFFVEKKGPALTWTNAGDKSLVKITSLAATWKSKYRCLF